VDFRALLTVLARAEVDFVVVGGVAALLEGAPITTFDLDLVHSREPSNLDRLHAVLVDLEACYREHLPKRLHPRRADLASDGHHLLATRHGPLDLLGTVVGGRSFEDLVAHTGRLPIDDEGLRVRVLDLETLIALKEEMGREKDLLQARELRHVLEERGRADGGA
jgi:hypothetical protein